MNHSYIQKKIVAVTSIGLCLFFYSVLLAEPVSLEQVQKAAETFLKVQDARQGKQIMLLSVQGEQKSPVRKFTAAALREIRDDDGTVLAYITELEPRGFIATSTDTDITPIIAYSFKNSFPTDEDRKNPLYRLLKEDMKLRKKALAEYDQFKTTENNNLWNLYADEDTEPSLSQTFQQFQPPEQQRRFVSKYRR